MEIDLVRCRLRKGKNTLIVKSLMLVEESEDKHLESTGAELIFLFTGVLGVGCFELSATEGHLPV